jgi:hypothetical protein
MVAVILAGIGASGAVVGLMGTILAAFKQSSAEHALRITMQRHQLEIMRLEMTKHSLALSNPDPKELTVARSIIAKLADQLNDSERSDILRTLDRGSDKSKANYILKLVGDYEMKEGSTPSS